MGWRLDARAVTVETFGAGGAGGAGGEIWADEPARGGGWADEPVPTIGAFDRGCNAGGGFGVVGGAAWADEVLPTIGAFDRSCSSGGACNGCRGGGWADKPAPTIEAVCFGCGAVRGVGWADEPAPPDVLAVRGGRLCQVSVGYGPASSQPFCRASRISRATSSNISRRK